VQSRKGGMHEDVVRAVALLSEAAGARAVGRIQWNRRGSSSARIGVVHVRARATLIEDSARLEMTVSRLRPTEPKIAYVADGGSVRRLCVNSVHQPFVGTHKHRVSGDPAGDCYEPDDIPHFELDGPLPPGAHRAIMEAFASECFIDTSDLEWVDPWEGG
jgi:hypothetical protein